MEWQIMTKSLVLSLAQKGITAYEWKAPSAWDNTTYGGVIECMHPLKCQFMTIKGDRFIPRTNYKGEFWYSDYDRVVSIRPIETSKK